MAKATRQAIPRARGTASSRAAAPVADRLRGVVEWVLGELTDGANADLERLEEALRVGLAWTAAAGDTCRVRCAATAVRQARLALAAGDRQQAVSALLAARDGLLTA